jgi:hypothetical protein
MSAEEDNVIDLWLISDMPASLGLGVLDLYLPKSEMARVATISRPELQAQFGASRVALRLILQWHTSEPGRRIEIGYSVNGKPIMKNRDVHFNLSHSANLFACAVSTACEVGIDVESITRKHNWFSRSLDYWASQWTLGNLKSTSADLVDYYQWWTGNEALWKAGGPQKLHHWQDLLTLCNNRHVRSTCGSLIDSGWQLDIFVPQSGFVGAIAYQGRHATLRKKLMTWHSLLQLKRT